jgi:hypothetical protein
VLLSRQEGVVALARAEGSYGTADAENGKSDKQGGAASQDGGV